jgi:hypothetical protein
MTDQDIIAVFETHHPASVDQARNLGLSPDLIATGSCRQCYKLTEGLAVKFCQGNTYQSEREIVAIQRIQSDDEFEPIRAMVLPLFYGNLDTGVIVTKYYPGKVNNDTREEDDEVRSAIRQLEKFGIYDLFSGNFRRDRDGKLIAVDLGYTSDRLSKLETAIAV